MYYKFEARGNIRHKKPYRKIKGYIGALFLFGHRSGPSSDKGNKGGMHASYRGNFLCRKPKEELIESTLIL
jgi:hypothetical protein